MQLGRWVFVDVLMFTVADKDAISVYLRSSGCCDCSLPALYCCILLISPATYPEHIRTYNLCIRNRYQHTTYAVMFFFFFFPILGGRLQHETNEGIYEQVKD